MLMPARKRIDSKRVGLKTLRDLDVEFVVSGVEEPMNELNKVVPIKRTS